ncbi:MAG: hypothetical protein RPU32_13570 [Candidatus Sedimenticola sp. (ex Thyasira tokunagai)]
MASSYVLPQATGATLVEKNIPNLIISPIPPPIQVVENHEELQKVRELRAAVYQKIYPALDVHDDPHDESAVILYSEDCNGRLISTARLAVDGAIGLPEDSYFPPEVNNYRRQGKCLLELGRLINQGGDKQLLKAYFWAIYNTAQDLEGDVILMAIKPKDISFYQRLGATLLAADMGVTYGGKHTLACLAWEIKHTKKFFFDWAGGEK